MDLFKKIKETLTGGPIPNPLGIPAPSHSSSLLFGTPEDIIKQYISMRKKTNSYFEYADSTKSLGDYSNAVMRYAAYSTVSIFGINLFFANHKLGVERLFPDKMNNMVYGKFLYDIADFSWVMLQYTFRYHDMSKLFSEEKISNFLNQEDTPELYWTLLFIYAVTDENADFACDCLRNYTKRIEALEPEKIDKLPSAQTKAAFEEMCASKLIGDPNEYRLFDAKHMIDVMGMGQLEIGKQRRELENSEIVKILTPEIKLHLLSNY